MVVLQRWLYYRGGCITEVAVLQRWLYYRGGCITEVAVLHRWLYYTGGCITEVAVLQRWLYYRGGCITYYTSDHLDRFHAAICSSWFHHFNSVGCVEIIVCWCHPPPPPPPPPPILLLALIENWSSRQNIHHLFRTKELSHFDFQLPGCSIKIFVIRSCFCHFSRLFLESLGMRGQDQRSHPT